ncbi:1,2-phenylacetyl-CoA epoxidase subunit PaaD [Pedomonas mirosovicensis]|uniref:1,2-phenylacetyl-CoA epoxidase subunit PaaD n=1 Tax=Pedomonas mirosovicensis TaxID=2908641 RepID=UPI0021682AAE|nr:1,2-phenylacetyl-CoA epoxidase subunit PaaD [Pedomonas mirosovicensis]MCH8684511.1 phenylacetate-CoA oxygenase subunit PaaJ [Pedomonas mirosovicensis]
MAAHLAPVGANAAAIEAAVWEVLAGVNDPEIPVLSIVDLGIVRRVEAGEPVKVVITPTYTGCPATEVISLMITAALEQAGYADADIVQEIDPPWTTDWISEDGRRKLREYGIAPPPPGSTSKRALMGETPALASAIACPRCGSTETERLSQFSSTPCKALHRCKACLEPFEAFKCH